MGGAIGKGIDRSLYGAVVDFVSLHAFGYRWYIFNMADVAIVSGVAYCNIHCQAKTHHIFA